MTIYLIKNIINGKCYIGQTCKPLNVRFNEHFSYAKTVGGTHLSAALNKYGRSAFQILPIVCGLETQFETDECEKFYILAYGTMNHSVGYNLTSGGRGASGYKQNPVSVEARAAKKRGTKHTDSAKEKMRAAKLGKTRSVESLAKASVSLKALNRKGIPTGQVSTRRRPILDSNGTVYDSIYHAAKCLGLTNGSHICAQLKGERNHVKGLTFKYLTKGTSNV